MTPEQYHAFTEQLKQNLENDSRVIGLVAAGSMAQTHHQPDEWSDHDFFVIVESGQQEDFRQNLHWLPDSENIVLSYRETEHGLKVVFRNGHLIEFAVFDLQELRRVKVNAYRVLLDRNNIEQEVRQIQADSVSKPPSDQFLVGQFLAHLMVGAGRYARGEQLSGHIFIKTYALTELLMLLAKHHDDVSRLDNLDPLRRFEFVFPEIGQALNQILLLDPAQAAGKMLKLFEQQFANRLTDYPHEAVMVISDYLSRVSAKPLMN